MAWSKTSMAGLFNFFSALSRAPYTIFMAIAFFPEYIILFINLATKRLEYFKSGSVCVFFLTGLLMLFCFLGSVFRTLLFSAFNSRRVQNASYYMITHTGQILDSSASQYNHRVFLKIVADTRNISGNFHPIGQSDPCNLSQSRIRCLRRGCLYR